MRAVVAWLALHGCESRTLHYEASKPNHDHAYYVDRAEVVAVTPCRVGVMMVNPKDLIGMCLYHFGDWERGDVVIEVGAHIGAHTVGLAKRVGRTGRVIAFEPQRTLYQMLNANLALNVITHVQTFPMAVADPERLGEQAEFPILNPKAVARWGLDPDWGGKGAYNYGEIGLDGRVYLPEKVKDAEVPAEAVRITTLDKLNVPKCDLVKVDVEGWELQVIKGAAALLQNQQPLLWLEFDHENAAKEDLWKYEMILELLAAAGYKVVMTSSDSVTEDNWRGQTLIGHPVGESVGRFKSKNLIAIHPKSRFGSLLQSGKDGKSKIERIIYKAHGQ